MVRAVIARGDARLPLPWWLRAVRNLAAQDWLLLGYFLTLLAAVWQGEGPARDACLARVATDLAVLAAGLAVVRGRARPATAARALLYRAVIAGPVAASYFQLRDILPVVSDRALDDALLALDLRVFGVEPALAWDRYVTPATVEWFAFFYFSYFALGAGAVLAFLLGGRDRARLAEFSLGILLVYCVGHLAYMVVPGYGPWRAMPEAFAHPLRGGLFWDLVLATVDAGGAQKDIFPSLHTAMPTFLALFLARHRAARPFSWLWVLVALAATQIVVATMFLRWHYLADVLAGLALAAGAARAAADVAAWERRRRAAMAVTPVYPDLWRRAAK